jgi:hypothetical protein
MAVALYMDVHVPQVITEQLRLRGVDVLTATEEGTDELPDDELLEHVRMTGRVLFTQDIRFKALAENWIRSGTPFAGLVFGHQLHGSIGQFVRDLQIIAEASDPPEWENRVEHIPF